ncbi:hypothetical protein [Francisella salina]|uniref:Uncharacterized protein n=1 Tax=Francisella salina TaxID=573569 RepID=A0ABM5MAG8_FRAST|nr:hypothetical protein [Francisella salina]AEI36180.1 hypothetical protein F7308_1254 [Francisella salina]
MLKDRIINFLKWFDTKDKAAIAFSLILGFCGFLFLILETILLKKDLMIIGIALLAMSGIFITMQNLIIKNYKEDMSFFRYRAENYESSIVIWKIFMIFILFGTFILITYFYSSLIKEFQKNYFDVFLMIPLTIFLALVYFFFQKRIYIAEVLHEEYSHKYSVELEYKKLLSENEQDKLEEFPTDELHKLWLRTLEINPANSIKVSKSKKMDIGSLEKISQIIKNIK